MLQHCFRDLERVAPGNPDTAGVRSALQAKRTTWRTWLGWLLVGGASLATMAHALWSARRRSAAVRPRAVAAVLALLGAVAAPLSAHAEPSADHPDRVSNWPIDDQNPESSIPTPEQRNRNPLEFGYWLQDLAFKATAASKRGDHAAAVNYYRAMATAVPDRAVSYSKLCDEYEAVGDIEKAILACKATTYLAGVQLKDYVHYVHLVVAKKGDLSAPEIASVSEVLDHLKQDHNGAQLYDELECEFAVRTDDLEKLKACTSALAASASASPATIVYEWTLAMKQQDFDGALKILNHGQRAGVNQEAIARMQKETDGQIAHRRSKIVLTVLGLLVVLGALGFGAVLLLRRRPPSPPAPRIEETVTPAAVSGS